MNARFYLPGTGRFASADTIVPDPADPQSLNRYRYARNNPVKFRDPSGHAEDCGFSRSSDCGDTNGTEVVEYYIKEKGYSIDGNSGPHILEAPVVKAIDDLARAGDLNARNDLMEVNTALRLYQANRRLETILDTADTALDVIDLLDNFYGSGVVVRSVPGTWIIPGLGQLAGDRGSGLSISERVTRAGITVFEGLVVDYVAIHGSVYAADAAFFATVGTGASPATFWIPPAAALAAGGIVYVGVQVGGDTAFEWLNDKYIFPSIHRIIPDGLP